MQFELSYFKPGMLVIYDHALWHINAVEKSITGFDDEDVLHLGLYRQEDETIEMAEGSECEVVEIFSPNPDDVLDQKAVPDDSPEIYTIEKMSITAGTGERAYYLKYERDKRRKYWEGEDKVTFLKIKDVRRERARKKQRMENKMQKEAQAFMNELERL